MPTPAGPAARYAKALYQQAGTDLPAVVAVAEQLMAQPALAALVRVQSASQTERAAAVADVLATVRAPAICTVFVHVLARNRRVALLPRILQVLVQLSDAAQGVVSATVTSAQSLTPSQRATITAHLQQLAPQAQSFKIQEVAQPSVLGGVKVQVGAQVWDATIRAHLNALAKHLNTH